MIELTEDQSQHLQANGEQLPTVRDPRTAETYVLVKADDYASMQAIVTSFARSTGWDDHELDVYEKYRKKE